MNDAVELVDVADAAETLEKGEAAAANARFVEVFELVIGHLHPPNPDNPIYQYMEQDPTIKAAMDANYMVGRVGRPEDLGHLCAFLCSAESGFITASTIRLDGGSQQVLRFPSLAGFPEWRRQREGATATPR